MYDDEEEEEYESEEELSDAPPHISDKKKSGTAVKLPNKLPINLEMEFEE